MTLVTGGSDVFTFAESKRWTYSDITVKNSVSRASSRIFEGDSSSAGCTIFRATQSTYERVKLQARHIEERLGPARPLFALLVVDDGSHVNQDTDRSLQVEDEALQAILHGVETLCCEEGILHRSELLPELTLELVGVLELASEALLPIDELLKQGRYANVGFDGGLQRSLCRVQLAPVHMFEGGQIASSLGIG